MAGLRDEGEGEVTLESDRIDLLLGDDGDLELDPITFDLTFSTGLRAVAQSCQIALNLVRGEWFANLDDGFPYFEREGVPKEIAILGQKFNQAKAVAAFTTALLDVDGVVEVKKLEVSFDKTTRMMSVNWVVRTEFGDTDLDTLEVNL
jgi:hypothetical protein